MTSSSHLTTPNQGSLSSYSDSTSLYDPTCQECDANIKINYLRCYAYQLVFRSKRSIKYPGYQLSHPGNLYCRQCLHRHRRQFKNIKPYFFPPDELTRIVTSDRLMVPSFRQEEIKRALLKLLAITNDQLKQGYRHSFLTNPLTGEQLKLDFYLPTNNLAVEYRGRHHYEFLPDRFDGSYEDFLAQRFEDFLKMYLCRQQEIRLVVVSYRVGNVYRYLKRHLRKLGLISPSRRKISRISRKPGFYPNRSSSQLIIREYGVV